jgi:hypothetical protein
MPMDKLQDAKLNLWLWGLLKKRGDDHETFAPTMRLISVHHNWELGHLDVLTDFLGG